MNRAEFWVVFVVAMALVMLSETLFPLSRSRPAHVRPATGSVSIG